MLVCVFGVVSENEAAVSVEGGTFAWGGNGEGTEEGEGEEVRTEAGPATLSK